jgi:aminoglycoside phosphotransferase (APT) family kinase protein
MDALLCDRVVKWYIARQGRPACSLPPDGEIKVVIPPHGLKTLTRIIEIDGVPWGVLRVFGKVSNTERLHRQRLNELQKQHQLPVPEVIDNWLPYNKNIHLSLEKYIDGTPLWETEMTGEVIDALADAFAQLHSVTADQCGFLAKPRGKIYQRATCKRIKNRYRSIRRRIKDNDVLKIAQHARKWLLEKSECLSNPVAFSLIHDKPNPGNMLWERADNRMVLIDLGTLQFGHAAADLAQLRAQTLQDDPDKTRRFHERYFANDVPLTPEIFQDEEPLFLAYFYLSQISINGRRLTKLDESKKHERQTCQQVIQKNVKRLHNIIGE